MSARPPESFQVPPIAGWSLEGFVLKYSAEEKPPLDSFFDVLPILLKEIEDAINPEYDIEKRGFLIVHYGNRGICVSIWHWGNWGPTRELFTASWYTFGRDLPALYPLPRHSPACCHHEICVLMHKFKDELQAN